MLTNYDSKGVVVVFNFQPVLGFQRGTFVSVEYNNDAFSLQVGIDGATRSKSNDNSGRVTVTLQQGSPSNDMLSQIHELDKRSPTGSGVKPLMVKDLTGRALHSAATAWIVKAPTAEYADESGAREWVFETDNLVSFVGGNLPPV